MNGNLEKAETRYKKSLETAVHEEPSYYAQLDLARISLKKRHIKNAATHLQEYLKHYSQEIRAAAGEEYDPDEFFGYALAKELVPEMKVEKMRLEKILVELERMSNE